MRVTDKTPALAGKLLNQASILASWGRNFPSSQRYDRAATALRALAKYVVHLDPSDARIRFLETAAVCEETAALFEIASPNIGGSKLDAARRQSHDQVRTDPTAASNPAELFARVVEFFLEKQAVRPCPRRMRRRNRRRS